MGKAELEREARTVAHWHHSIDLGQGVVTDGEVSVFSFEAECRGAASVVASGLAPGQLYFFAATTSRPEQSLGAALRRQC